MKTAFQISIVFTATKFNHGKIAVSVRILVLVVFLGSGLTAPLYAQIEGVKEGDRIRINAPSVNSVRLAGNVTELSSTAVVLVSNDSTYTIPYTSIEKLAISTGKRTRVVKGALWGVLIGSVVGMTIGSGTYQGCNTNCGFEAFDQLEATYRGFLIGSAAGLISGAIIGSKERDRWERLPVRLTMESRLNRSLEVRTKPVVTFRVPLSGSQ